MADITGIKRLSDAISIPILKAYRAGGLGLVFVFVGTVLLLSSLLFERGILCYIIATIATLMILAVLCLFYFQDIRKLKKLHTDIKHNQELLDTVQATAIQMTNLSFQLQALAFKHANQISETITLLRKNVRGISTLPFLSNISGFERVKGLADNEYVVNAEDLSKSIVMTTETAKIVIEDIKTALVNSNPILLKKYLVKVEELENRARDLLQK